MAYVARYLQVKPKANLAAIMFNACMKDDYHWLYYNVYNSVFSLMSCTKQCLCFQKPFELLKTINACVGIGCTTTLKALKILNISTWYDNNWVETCVNINEFLFPCCMNGIIPCASDLHLTNEVWRQIEIKWH